MTEKKYRFDFESGAFERQNQRTRITNRKKYYTQEVAENNKTIDVLYRIDDFNSLKISPDTYKAVPGLDYGIAYANALHTTGKVILDHQQAAALQFLRELRGFGLLADVVGSGKTFEACVVLSELAVRNKLRSMLLIVPGQVKQSWINVLEKQFGLGKDVLLDASEFKDENGQFRLTMVETFNSNGFIRPKRPIVVTTEEFVKWDEEFKSLLFDVIVVDEAHHLSSEEGQYAKAMRLLSLMMETKKKANSTYCLLLSATPHSGNLEHMFRLWYFIRCKGGNPEDFIEKEDISRTATYRQEKEYYKDVVCRGATTVMEFVKNVKKREVFLNYYNEFKEYLANQNIDIDALSEIDKNRHMIDFLDENYEICNAVMKTVASAYHNGVLRSIMIRQPNKNLLGKTKTIKNILFFPTRKTIGKINVKGLNEEDIIVDAANLTSNKAVLFDGEYYSVAKYVEEFKGSRSFYSAYADFIISKVINTIDNIGADDYNDTIFIKKNTIQYYIEQISRLANTQAANMKTDIIPVTYNSNDDFTHKFNKSKELLDIHSKERVLIFFDYDLRKKDTIEKFVRELKNDPNYKNRVVEGLGGNRDHAVRKFNEIDNAILIVEDASFTEGANLQKSSVIINFQVTPDPLSMDQRIGRIFRLGQENNVVIYSLADMNKLEGYVLMYFARIGLLTSNSGDATIIAGSNSDRMVAIRCKVCGKVELIDQDEYKYRREHNELYCFETDKCRRSENDDNKMEEICVYDFKCSTCGSSFTRSATEEGYLCISSNNDKKGIMCNSGEQGDRKIYCRKICSMAHCEFFKLDYMNCPALEDYKKNRNISDLDLMTICSRCNNPSCPKKCRVGVGPEAIAGCVNCFRYATICYPRQQIIVFDENWVATCPKCAESRVRGKIKPVVARTFATYIRSSWNFNQDQGRAFCRNLLKEANKVAEIKQILDSDILVEEDMN